MLDQQSLDLLWPLQTKWYDDQRWHDRSHVIALGDRGLDEIINRRAARILKNQLNAFRQPTVSLRPDLDHGQLVTERDAEDIRIAVVGTINELAFGKHRHGSQTIARASGIFVALFRRRALHVLFERCRDGRGVTIEELDHLIDQRAVILFRNLPHAGRRAAPDVKVQTGRSRTTPRGRPLAGTKRKHAIEHFQCLSHHSRIRVRAKQSRVSSTASTRKQDTRKILTRRDSDHRIRLIVAQTYVERRL